MWGGAYEDDEEVAAVVVEVVTGAVRAGGAEHRRVPAQQVDKAASGSCPAEAAALAVAASLL